MHTSYLYASKADDRRALLVDIDTALVHHTRLMIRADDGRGQVLLNKVYTTHRGARAALNRRGAWTMCRKSKY